MGCKGLRSQVGFRFRTEGQMDEGQTCGTDMFRTGGTFPTTTTGTTSRRVPVF